MLGYDLPLRARFRGLTRRQGLLVHGPAGWGEFAPFADYTPAQESRWAQATEEAAQVGWPAARRGRVPVNVTIPALDPSTAAQWVEASAGCSTAKVKVADPGVAVPDQLRQDCARLAAVREALGAQGSIRIDANAAWSVEQAEQMVPVLERAAGGLEYVEQPCATVAQLAALRRRVRVPLAADEVIRTAADPQAALLEVARAGAADVLVLKVAALGGVRSCLALAEQAGQLGLEVVVSSALESSVGLAAGVALAAALPHLELACGLATAGLLARDTVPQPPRVVQGHLEVADFRCLQPDLATLQPASLDLLHRWQAAC